ncbi:MAG: GDP-mannose 4,6-dehydratase, partial [Finegoldia magna]|nr:GDP-mannose 4,6-dehydratase [Finegoldia magna]
MNILIIGGLGFIGTNLALRLINRGYNVTVLDNFSKCNVENYEELKGKCNIIIGSIYSEMTLNKYFSVYSSNIATA